MEAREKSHDYTLSVARSEHNLMLSLNHCNTYCSLTYQSKGTDKGSAGSLVDGNAVQHQRPAEMSKSFLNKTELRQRVAQIYGALIMSSFMYKIMERKSCHVQNYGTRKSQRQTDWQLSSQRDNSPVNHFASVPVFFCSLSQHDGDLPSSLIHLNSRWIHCTFPGSCLAPKKPSPGQRERARGGGE